MARSNFGGSDSNALAVASPSLNGGLVKSAPNISGGTAWSASTGGTQYTDLIIPGGGATTVRTDADGFIKVMQGPDGVNEGLWVDLGSGTRFYLRTTDGLNATYGPWPGARPGNRLAVIGDSTCKGVYASYDSNPPIGGTSAYSAGDSWITWASTLSGGKVNRSLNGGVTGDTIAMMDARVAADIIAAVPKPAACIVYSGYNDAYGNITPAAFMTSYASIVGKLRAAGIVPIAATPLPTLNNATIADLLVRYSLKIRKYALDQGLVLLDFQQWAMDSTNGGLLAAVGTGGDGVHPGAAGQKVLGQKVADTLTPILALSSLPLQISPLDASNLAPNGLFAGAVVSGKAPNVFTFGSLQTGVTPSVVTDALVPGSMQRATHAGSTVMQQFAMRINQAAGNWSAGDVLEFSGIITRAGVLAELQVDFNTAPYNQKAISLTNDVTRGYYCARIPVPAGIGVTYIDCIFNSGPGTGTADFGQLTVRNLTTLGLV